MNKKPDTFLSIALRRETIKRSLIVAVIVGTVLNIINQGDVVSGNATFDLLKCVLTYLVPFCESTYGSASALLSIQRSQTESQMKASA